MPSISSQFDTMPLLRQFFMLDIERGIVVRHEVRRDPSTGLTLTASYPLALAPPTSTHHN